jgi:hypothetical protein
MARSYHAREVNTAAEESYSSFDGFRISNRARSRRQQDDIGLSDPFSEYFSPDLLCITGDMELMSHYADASLPQQLDAFVWFDESSAVTPLGPQYAKAGAPDTYAFGL